MKKGKLKIQEFQEFPDKPWAEAQGFPNAKLWPKEGVKVGYTRNGLKPCLHPLLAVPEEAKLVAGFWLRAGNASSTNNLIAFTLESLSLLPSHLRVRLVRADSGFCQDDWLSLLEARPLPYIVVAKLNVKIQRLP